MEHRSDRLSRKQNLPKKNEDLKYELMQNDCNETETRIAIPVIKGQFPIVVQIKNTNFCIPMKLKATISIIVQVGKNDVHIELHG